MSNTYVSMYNFIVRADVYFIVRAGVHSLVLGVDDKQG